jgi:phosphoglycerate dehydrogenase-like enzyme
VQPSQRSPHAHCRSGGSGAGIRRGDEDAFLAALAAGTLRGVGLDVYDGEFERAPDPRLWRDARVLITPHVSGGTDVAQPRVVELFCQNLRAYLDGRLLVNVIDWQRGY